MSDRKVRIAIVGVGNCASSLVQGLEFYKDAPVDEPVPGLMNATLGGYHIRDVEIAAAFAVNGETVGKDVADAVFAPPTNTHRFARGAPTRVPVERGGRLNGRARSPTQ